MRSAEQSIQRIEYKYSPVMPRCHMSERGEEFPNFEQFISTLEQSDFLQYPNVMPLKERIAERHGVGIENVFIGSGSDRVINALFNALLNPSDIVVTTPYYFRMYDVYARQNMATLLNCTDVVDPSVKLAIIANPCSTLGTGAELKEWRCPVIIDNAYIDFGGTQFDVKSMIDQDKIFTYSFSKGWGGAGARVGYAIANAERIAQVMKFRDMFEITGPSVKFALWLLDNEESIKVWRAKILNEKFDLRDIAIIPQYGNWIYLSQDTYDFAGQCKRDIDIPELSIGKLLKVSIVDGVRKFISERS